MQVVDAMVNVPTDSLDEPVSPITMDVNILKMSAKDLKNFAIDFD